LQVYIQSRCYKFRKLQLWSFVYSFSPSTWIAFLSSTAEQAEGHIHQKHSLEPSELV